MNVALLLFTCIVLASCSFSDSYLVGKTRDPFWAHRPYGRSNNNNNNRRPTPTPRRYSNYNNNNNKLNNRFSNNIDNHLTEIKLKKFFHGDDSKYRFQYPFFNNNNNKNSFKWDSQAVNIMNKVKMPKMPPMPAMPINTGMDMREWPEYIPPISMIKLPLDTPPAAIN